MDMLNIHVRFGIPYNSRSNSEVERMNRKLREKMKIFDMGNSEHEIKLALAIAVMEINATPIPQLEICPFEIIYGHTPRPFIGHEIPAYKFRNMTDFVIQKYNKLMELQDAMQKYYDKRIEEQGNSFPRKLYTVGQKVRILNRQRKGQTKHTYTYLPYSKEVYEVKEVRRSSKSYLLELLDKRDRQKLRIILHHRRIKPIFQRPLRLQQLENDSLEHNATGESVESNTIPEVTQSDEIDNLVLPNTIKTMHLSEMSQSDLGFVDQPKQPINVRKSNRVRRTPKKLLD